MCEAHKVWALDATVSTLCAKLAAVHLRLCNGAAPEMEAVVTSVESELRCRWHRQQYDIGVQSPLDGKTR